MGKIVYESLLLHKLPRHSTLVSLLGCAYTLLSRLDSCQYMLYVLDPFMYAVIDDDLFHHLDIDVQITVVSRTCEILCVTETERAMT